MRWDIFCRVIDNYGDIGVCWRLARQLATEHGLAVRLWVDDLASLHRLCPETDPQAAGQHRDNVDIRQWSQPFPDVAPAEVVIEAFGCELPENYLAAMAQMPRKPVWINLEYLSAEPWIEGCHGLPSPHPRLPLTKYFFFPGLTAATGGLLRESQLLTQRDALQAQPAQCWQPLHLPHPDPRQTVVSLFCYDTAPLGTLLDAWTAASQPVLCLLPEGQALTRVAAHFGLSALMVGDTVHRGNLTLRVLPFLRQEDYDTLLWACDCNFVRGEDSFVRAQWAGKPLVWQIYVQQEAAHLLKLDAFLDRYCAGMAGPEAEAVRAFHHGWNNDGMLDWAAFQHSRTALQRHAETWAAQLAAHADLAAKLVIFCKNQV